VLEFVAYPGKLPILKAATTSDAGSAGQSNPRGEPGSHPAAAVKFRWGRAKPRLLDFWMEGSLRCSIRGWKEPPLLDSRMERGIRRHRRNPPRTGFVAVAPRRTSAVYVGRRRERGIRRHRRKPPWARFIAAGLQQRGGRARFTEGGGGSTRDGRTVHHSEKWTPTLIT
jgi:hypothetical protein